jgi:hypothetical protein
LEYREADWQRVWRTAANLRPAAAKETAGPQRAGRNCAARTSPPSEGARGYLKKKWMAVTEAAVTKVTT